MTVQIAVKLPDDVVAAVDNLISEGRFPNRSHATRYALEALLRAEEHRQIDQAFREGFRRVPETDAEMADATRLALEAIEDEPWDRWW